MRAVLIFSALLVLTGVAQAREQRLDTGQAEWMTLGASTSMPYGWVDFCGRRPDECQGPSLEARRIVADTHAAATIERVNREVNAVIEPVSNLDHWGTLLDHWDYLVDGRGDCKIYAIEKRRRLMALGFPRQALLLTIVHDREGAGHAILTAVTDRGDFILDNLTDAIRPWASTGYAYVKRQSQEDPNVWLAIEPVAATSPQAGLAALIPRVTDAIASFSLR